VQERELEEASSHSTIVDEVQEAIAKGKEYSYKIKLPNKTKFSVPVWDTGTQEAFLIHMQQAKSTCKKKGLFQDYNEAIEVESEATDDAKNFWEAIANATGPKSKKNGTAPNQPSLDEL
jgi:hypothetical protein